MTTQTLVSDALATCAISGEQLPGLRLVAGGACTVPEHRAAANDRALPCAELKSAIADKTPIVLSVLTDLFRNLRQGERIEFVHRISRSDSGNVVGTRSYRLAVNVACRPEQADKLKRKTLEALLTGFHGFHLGACAEAPDCSKDILAPHVLQLALSGVVVTAKPAVTRFEDKAWQSSPALRHKFRDDTDRDQKVWPFPGKLANWALTAPLDEPMDLPETVEISVRMHAFSINGDACESLNKTLFRVLSGNLSIFHPESPIAAYSASPDLQDSVADLIRHWLRHPSGGYAVDCVVRSSAPLGEVAQRRIAADVFGKRPFEVVRSFDMSAPQPLAQPTFAWANTPDQGIPAIMPGPLRLPTLGVPRHYPEPLVTPPRLGAVLGNTVCGQRSSVIALPAESRSRHVALFGATGSGKSSLLTQMIAEDIADPHRSCGVGLIDPHGDLYQRVLAMIPPERTDDVVLIDTSDQASSVCLNPLEGMQDDPLHAQFVVAEIMSLIELLFETKDSNGPLLRSNLRNLLLLSASRSDRHGTFLDAVRIIEDTDYCDYLLSKCKNRNVVEYWKKFKNTTGSDNGYGSWAPYLMARLVPFVSNPIMKRLLNRPDSTVDLAQAMRDKKIVLFNLSKGVLQDVECQVLGSLILMKFFSAALSRARLPADKRSPFHLYVDEFQSFATDSVPRLFSESRKFGLCLTTANQSLGQLNNRWGRSNIAESILANTATKFLFRLGPSDMETLQPYYKPQFDEETMATLPDFHAVACMSDRNRPLPPFVLRANLAATDPNRHVAAADLVNLSAQRYSVPIDQANKELIKLFDLSAESLAVRATEPPPAILPYRPGPAMKATSVSVARTGE
ncbi:MAG: type IV secretion system DNA-binding domain-containing protein [Proteobacteria bacterium]|nr:type IV secretion system DNA-binding domain-containing protein [Pseudomonadota bacterium]